jgi:hypothetical protein
MDPMTTKLISITVPSINKKEYEINLILSSMYCLVCIPIEPDTENLDQIKFLIGHIAHQNLINQSKKIYLCIRSNPNKITPDVFNIILNGCLIEHIKGNESFYEAPMSMPYLKGPLQFKLMKLSPEWQKIENLKVVIDMKGRDNSVVGTLRDICPKGITLDEHRFVIKGDVISTAL